MAIAQLLKATPVEGLTVLVPGVPVAFPGNSVVKPPLALPWTIVTWASTALTSAGRVVPPLKVRLAKPKRVMTFGVIGPAAMGVPAGVKPVVVMPAAGALGRVSSTRSGVMNLRLPSVVGLLGL